MWQFLLVGTFGAVGAAMAVGTVAALIRFRRTGTWPGSDEPAEVSTTRRLGLYARVAAGGGVAVYAAVSLSQAGLI